MTSTRFWRQTSASTLSGLAATIAASALTLQPARAHHPFGGELPTTAIQGLLSGFGHPVIGFDHLVFTIAIGAISLGYAVGRDRATADKPAPLHSWLVIASFLMATIVGTMIHLQEWNLPAPELAISGSVLLLGILLLTQQSYSALVLVAIAGLAGLFHGYAYGEAVVGAEPTPVFAYLVGFTTIQGAIAVASGLFLRRVQRNAFRRPTTFPTAVALGGIVAGVGMTFLLEAVLA